MSDETKPFVIHPTGREMSAEEISATLADPQTWVNAYQRVATEHAGCKTIADQHRRLLELLRRWMVEPGDGVELRTVTHALLTEIDGATPVKP